MIFDAIQGHSKGVYPIIFIPCEDDTEVVSDGPTINPGDILITGSADTTARSWSFEVTKIFSFHKVIRSLSVP